MPTASRSKHKTIPAANNKGTQVRHAGGEVAAAVGSMFEVRKKSIAADHQTENIEAVASAAFLSTADAVPPVTAGLPMVD
jgi:hypothetical protein